MRSLPLLLSIAVLTASAHAAPPQAPGDMPRASDMTAEDVAMQPLGDANLHRKAIPPQLANIVADPYALDGLVRCREIIAAVQSLDAVLGPDFDSPMQPSRGIKRRKAAMTVASGAIASLIPFRFLIRELSGANKSDEAFRSAVYAGVVRRGFLKGYGQSRGCKVPGKPVPLIEAATGAIRTPLR